MLEGISIREFARRDGCNDKVVRRKIQSGHLTAFSDGSLDPELVGTDWRARTRTGAKSAINVRAVPGETPEEAADRIVNVEGRAPYTKAEAERIKENYLAMLRQIEYDRESGSVAEIDDVVIAAVSEYALVRNKVLSLSSRIAPRVAALRSADEIKTLIDKEIAQTLEELTLDGHGSKDIDQLRRDVQRKFTKAS